MNEKNDFMDYFELGVTVFVIAVTSPLWVPFYLLGRLVTYLGR